MTEIILSEKTYNYFIRWRQYFCMKDIQQFKEYFFSDLNINIINENNNINNDINNENNENNDIKIMEIKELVYIIIITNQGQRKRKI